MFYLDPWGTIPKVEARLAKIDADLAEIARLLGVVIKQGEREMSALSDLQEAVAGMTSAVSDAVSEIEELLGKITTPGASEADIQAAADQIKSLTTKINDEIAKSNAASP